MRKSNTHLMRLFRNPIIMLAMLWALASPIHGQVEAALDQAEAWLVGQQRPDGSFATVEKLAPRDSALAVLALHDRDPAGQAVTQGLIYLTGVPEANSYFRTHRILALAQAGRDVQLLLDSLLDFRNGGGMGAYWSYQSNVLGTVFAVEALAADELSHQLDIVGLLDYLQLHQNTDGGWGFLSGGPSEVYYTAEILDAMAQLEQLAVGSGVLSGAAGFLTARQQANGGFGTVLETAVAYRALLAAGFAPSDLPFGSTVPYLLAQQQGDRSWEGDAFVTAQVVRVLRGERPNLIVTEVTATPQTVTPGTLVKISITVRNIGPAAAAAGYVAVRLDTSDGEELAEAALPAFAAGATTTIEVDVDTTDQTGDALDLVAVADSREELAEIDETDNTATVRITLQSGPDLALFPADLSLEPAEPRPGEDFELLVQVRNLGETEVASFDYRVSELIAGVPAELPASGSDGPIAAGGGRLLTIPLNLPEGEHSLEVEIDPEHLVEEESEDNNLASLSFFVVDASQPDLALLEADLVLDPPQPTAGETVAVDVTLHNFGSRDATVDLELYEDGPADGSALLESWTLTVASGDAVAVNTSAVVSADAYALTAVADPGQAIPELDESNNRVRRVFRDLPDLAIGYDNFEFLPAQPLEGDPVEVSVTVRNAGTAAAADVALEVFSGDPDAGGSSVFTHVFAAIPPAANRRVSFTWTAPAGLTTLVAEVDGDAVIPEFSETNNRAEREVAVPRASGPDLVVATIDPSGLSESAEALSVAGSVALGIANLGDADVSDPFLVRLYVDANGDGRLTSGEPVLASTVVSDPIAAGGALETTLAVDATVPFFHPLVWAEVDSGDVVAEQREDNNRATLYGDCATAPPAGTIDPREEWFVPGIEVETAPIVVQLSDDNGDGAIDSRDTPDVVFHAVDAEGNVLLALSGLDGSELWSFRSTPANPLVMQLGQVAAADLDGDGVAEVLGMQRDGRMIALKHDGRLLWVSDPVEGVGNRSLGGPSVGDLDADGVPEIVIGRAVLSNTGELIALGTANRGRNYNYYGPLGTVLVPGTTDYPHSLIADVDLDGTSEIVAGDTLYRLVDGTLWVVWDQVVPDKLMVDGFSAVGNLDGDPEAEIVYVSSNHIMILNHDGTAVQGWRQIIPLLPFEMPTYWGGPPTIADLDGDGAAEILVAGATELVAYRSNLNYVLWRRPIGPDFGGISGVSAFDLDGDGDREVLFLDENTFYIVDGPTGELLYTRPNTSKTGTEFPVVADVDGDGRAEILLPSNTAFNGDTTTQGLHVLGHPSWQGTRPIWNQYSYHVTNVALDGTVPVDEVPWWQAAAGSAANTFRVNQELPAPVPYLPNLTVSLPRIGAGSPEGVPITLRIGNGGREAVGAGVAVGIYSGDPASSEPEAETVTTRGLRPGEWIDLTLLWQASVEVGTPLVAVIDPQDAIAECSEDDNAVGFVLVETLLADLWLPADGLVAPAVASVGQRVTIGAQVGNAGTAVAPASVVRLLSGDPAVPVAEAEVGPVALDERVPVELTWDTRGLLTGTYFPEVRVDADGTVEESDEANNAALVAIELVAPTVPDLSLEELRLEPAVAVAGDSVRITAVVSNRGIDLAGGFETALVIDGVELNRVPAPADLAAGAEQEVTFDFDTLGRPGVLSVEVRLDPGGLIAESDEQNNRASRELVINPVSLGLAVATDRIGYAPNQNVALELVAENASDATVRDLTVRIVDAFGVEIAEVANQPWELQSGETVLHLSWNTGATPPGTYAIVAELAEGAVVRVRAVSGLSIATEIAVEATLLADRYSYAPHQTAILTGAVTNAGANTVMNDVTARVAIIDAEYVDLFSNLRTIGSLSPGAVVSIAASWDVAAASPGSYTASLSVRDDLGRLVAYASTELLVESSADTGAGLVGELSVAPTAVGAGAPVVATWTVTNTGNADLENLGMRVDLLAVATEEVVDFEDTYLDLAQQQTRLGGAAFPTLTLEVGTYLATLTALVPGGERRLDSAAFTVGRGISVSDLAIIEGDSGSQIAQFAVTLSSSSTEAITVDYATADASATAGVDYQAATGTVSFAPGETAATVEVAILGDLEVEIDELFLLTLGNPTGVLLGDAQGLGTIVDEEGCASPNLLQNPGAEESDPATAVPGWTEVLGAWSRRFGDPVPLAGVASFAVNGGAELIQDVDVSAFAQPIDAATQSFAFAAFLHSAPESAGARLIVEFRDLDNATVLDQFDSGAVAGSGEWQAVGAQWTAPAGTRRIRVRLITESEAAIAAFDRIGLHSVGRTVLTIADATVAEGNSGTTPAGFRLALSCPAVAPIDVDYVTAAGSATPDVDFVSASETVSFAAGEIEQTLTVEVVGDGTDEDDETFSVVLSQSTDALLLESLASATILDDDGAVTISIVDATVMEGDAASSDAVFEIRLSAVSGRVVEVDYATADATAASGDDYLPRAGTLSFQPGETSHTVTVPVQGDLLGEGDETFLLRLSQPVHATLTDAEGTATIRDDDEVEIRIDDLVQLEGDAGSRDAVFTVRLSLLSAREVTVSFATADVDATAGDDYLAAAGVLTFPPGTVAASLSVPILGDLEREPHESFLVHLSGAVNATLADPEAAGTIFDDDGILISIADAAVVEGDEGGEAVTAVFTVALSKPSPEEVTVDYTTVDGTALAPADYLAAAATLSFAPGTTEQSVVVEIVGDLEEERTEHFAVELTAAVHGEIVDGHAEATLYDNDGWYLNGDPRPIPDQCIELTAGDRRQQSSAWKKQLLDLRESFDKTFRVFLGDYDEGDEGMVFTLQTMGSTALGTLGMGYYNISPSVGVELDTYFYYYHDGPHREDHIAVDLNGGLRHASEAVAASGENIEDGQEHELRLIWNAAAKVLDVHFDHEERLIYEKDLVSSVFGSQPLVYYGFTSRTVTNFQRQYFCPTFVCYGDGSPPRISIGDATVEEGDAGTVQAIFPVTLSCPTDQVVTVEYATTDDTAIAGSDYHTASGTVSFEPGETSRHVTVEVMGDLDGEAAERFFVRLRDPVGGEIRYGEGVGTILSDDALFRLEGQRFAEGEHHHGGEFQGVSLLGPITREARVRVKTVTGTTSTADHYTLNQTLTFRPGETEKFFELRIKGDELVEGDEYFFVTLSDMVRGTALSDRVEFRIEDDDDAVCPTGRNLIVNGSAEIPMIGDEIPGWTPVSGSWRIVSGGADWVGGHLEANCGGDNELYQDVDLSTYANQIDRGDLTLRFEGLMMEYTLEERGDLVVEALDAGRQNVLDRFDGREFVPAAYKHNRLYARVARIFLPPAGTRWIRVRLLTGCTTAFDAFTLRTLRAPALMIDDVAVDEGDVGTTRADFQVRLLCASDYPVSVDYLSADGTAHTPGDYQPTQGRLVFQPGELSQLVGVEVRGDTLTEGDETFFLHLANSLEAGIGDGEGMATILDDEVFLSIADVTVVEGDGGTTAAVFTVSLSEASALEVRVDYATHNGSATAGHDFLESSGTLIFAPGEQSRQLTVAVLGDDLPEPDESFEVHLSAPIRASLASSVGTGWIRNDDLTFSIGDGAAVEGNAGTTAMTFEVSLSGESSETTQVSYATRDGNAIAGVDYEPAAETLVFAPGQIRQQFQVTVVGDTEAEATEFFLVELSGPVAADVGDGEAHGFITDDDDCAGPNLLLNPGFELDLAENEIPEWTEHAGAAWGTRSSQPSPFAGEHYAHPEKSGPEPAELRQEVDVSAYATFIDRGIQRFLFEAAVRSRVPSGDSEPDPTRLVVEYWDAGGENLLGVFDSGEMSNTDSWRQVVDLRAAPVGTRSIRVRLIARTTTGSDYIYGYFDALALRSLDTPTVSSQSLMIEEGDHGTQDAIFQVRLSCAAEEDVTVAYQSFDGTAVTGIDYQAVAGQLLYAPGETLQEIAVPIVGDVTDEHDTRFTLELASSANTPVVRPVLVGTILDDDPAPFFLVDDVIVVEGDAGEVTEAIFTLRLSVPSDKVVSVNFATAQGSATHNVDYAPTNGTATFAVREDVITVSVPILGDDLVESDEQFFVDFSSATHLILVDSRAIATILDNDDDGTCAGPDLLINGSGEAALAGGAPEGWTPVAGGAWTRRFDSPEPFDGAASMAPGAGAVAELVQDVDVSPYADAIAAGLSFRFTGAVRVASASPPDTARVIVEYRDASNTAVLSAYDSGALTAASWTALLDERQAPTGTGWIRVRLMAERMSGETTDTYFDGLTLRSLGVPTLAVDDVFVSEGRDAEAIFRLLLSCAAPVPFTVPFATRTGTATAGEDFVATTGAVVFEPGEILHTVAVALVDDAESDPDEVFRLVLDGSQLANAVVLADPEPRAFISDDDSIILDLALCLDASESISASEFRLQLNGTAAAVEDPAIVPHNGTVRITLLQFSYLAHYEIPPTVIDRNNAAIVGAAIRAISKVGGGTAIHNCIDAAAPVITQATPLSLKQVIDVSTDGESSKPAAVASADNAIATGLDVLNAIGVGGGISLDLLNAMVRPQPSGGAEGFVVLAADFNEYAEAIAQKIRREANPDLFVTKTDGLDSAVPGTPNRYTIMVTNIASGTVSSLRVVDPLPSLLAPIFTPSSGVFDPETGLWTGISLGLDESLILEVDGVIDPAATGELVNTVVAEPPAGVSDINPDDNTATDTTALTPAADLSLSKQHDGDLVAGGVGAYRLVVGNLGPSQAAGPIEVVDVLPESLVLDSSAGDGWSCTADAGTVTCTHPGPVAAGGSLPVLTLGVRVGAEAPAQLTNTATVSAPTPDPQPSNNSASDPTTVGRPALEVTKADSLAVDPSGDGEANPGDVVRYEIAVANTGTAIATGVVLSDAIPAHTSVVAGSVVASQGTVTSEDPVTVESGEIPAGGTVTVTFDVAIDAVLASEVGQIVNQAMVTSIGLADLLSDDPDLPGESDPTVTPVFGTPEITATKVDALHHDADGDGVSSPGDTLRYTITVGNPGNGAASGVVFRDLVPAHTALVPGSVTAGAGTVTSEDPVEVEIGLLAVAAEVTVTFDVVIDHPFPLGVDRISNQGTVTSDQLPAVPTDDPDVGGATDPTETLVVAAPRLLAEKTDALHADHDGDGVPSPGDEIAYTVTLGNAGNTAATGVTFLDPIPAHAVLVAGSVAAGAGTVVAEAPLEVEVGQLAVGDEVVITFRVTVANPIPAGVTEIANQGAVAADGVDDVLTDDPDAGGTEDPTVTAITAAPVLVVEKTDALLTDADGDAAASPGDELLYRIEIGNTGNTGATGVAVSDVLPVHTALVAGTVQTSQGTVVSEDPLAVDLGLIAAGTSPAVVTFRVTIADPFPTEVTEVANQATVTSVELEPVTSDDPDTAAPGDPTATEVFITPEIAIDDVTVTEDAGLDAVFTVALSEASNRPVTVSFATQQATATGGVDYQAASGDVVFAAGETSLEVPIGVLADLLDEPDETFTLELTAADGAVVVDGHGLGTILDDDEPPLVHVAGVTVDEGDADTVEALFAVTLAAASGFDVTVSYQTADGSAVAGVDYQAAAGAVVIPAGSQAAVISVPVIGDLLDEDDETFTVQLTGVEHGLLGTALATGTILDDDEPPAVAIADVAVVEGDAGMTEAVFTLALSGASGREIRVDYATTAGTALAGVDYESASGTVTLPAGTLSGTVTVAVVGDLIDELDETFGFELANPQHVVIGDGLGVGTIVDDDEALITIDDVAVAEGDTETGEAIFTVALATPSDREIRVDYATVAATATAGEDYLTTSGTLVFVAGVTEQTLAVAIVGDVILERDETFRVELSNPVNTTIEDAEGLGTILDDELCVGPNLLVNPGAEARPVDGEIPGWTMVSGSDWQRRFAPPEPIEGVASFFAGTAGLAELVQDVDVSAYAARIAAGDQHFAFDGYVRTFDEVPPDVASIVVEYRDAGNSVALDTFDSGEILPYGWHQISDVRAAPSGTGWIRVRLIATRFTEGDNDGYFDALSLRSLRAPTVEIDDVVAYEGHSGTTQAIFTVDLACAYEHALSVDYLTFDVTALAGEDYLEASGSLAFPVGLTTRTIPVPILADAEDEPDETFLVELSNLSATGDPVLLHPLGIGTIRNDDFCPRSHGYWKNHTEEWPVDWLVLGGVEYDAAELMAFLEYKGKDAASKLALQLVATKLNLVSGSDPWILPVVETADAFLEIYSPGSNPTGEARQEGNAIKDVLDAYNNSCPND